MPVEWDRVRYFRKEEWVKDPDLVSPDLVYLLDEVRASAGTPILIHVCWDDVGHITDSGHYTTSREFAVAVDFHIVGWSLLRQWLYVERFPFNGIGLYPFWQNQGLHVDLRRVGQEHPNLGRRWWRDQDGTYKALDKQFLASLMAVANDV